MALAIKFWGVRGSLPYSPHPEEWQQHIKKTMLGFFVNGYKKPDQVENYLNEIGISLVGGYGSATTCVEAKTNDTQIIIDGGSGIKRLGESMLSGPAGKGKGKVHIFMTHFHWDHVLGFPFFVPIFIPGNEVHFYAVQSDMPELIKGMFRKPYFPVPFEALGAKVFFHLLKPREALSLGDMSITPYMLDHPDPCWGYKVAAGGKAYAHCVDSEGTRSSPETLGPDLPLYQGVDLMYWDAQYTLPELAEKSNWGHSAAQIGLDIAMREGIRQVMFAHHDPGADTLRMQLFAEQTQEYYNWCMSNNSKKGSLHKVDWGYAFEGQEIVL